jgi:hypothetical protein
VLGAVGVATVIGAAAFGIIGIAIATLAVPGFVRHRRRRGHRRPVGSIAVTVAAPTARSPR